MAGQRRPGQRGAGLLVRCKAGLRQWFAKDPAFDALLRERFLGPDTAGDRR